MFKSIWLGILSFFTSNAFDNITEKLLEAYSKKLEAATNEQKLEAEITITQLKARQEILLQDLKYGPTRWIRPLIAAPFIIFIWKVVVWDKVLQLGVTDPLSDNMSWVLMAVISFFLLTRPFEKWVSK